MRDGRFQVVMLVVLAVANTGCGIVGWAATGKSEVTSYTLQRTAELEVSSVPKGATIIADGGEAGVTPGAVRAVVTEVRHQRRQSIVPGLVGIGLDVLATGIAAAICIDSNSGECLLMSAGIGLGTVVTGTYLVFGRSFRDEGTDVLPTLMDITVKHPGYQEQTRRIRVPDLTEVDFNLVPLGGQAPAGSQIPGSGPSTSSGPSSPSTSPTPPDAPTRRP